MSNNDKWKNKKVNLKNYVVESGKPIEMDLTTANKTFEEIKITTKGEVFFYWKQSTKK